MAVIMVSGRKKKKKKKIKSWLWIRDEERRGVAEELVTLMSLKEKEKEEEIYCRFSFWSS